MSKIASCTELWLLNELVLTELPLNYLINLDREWSWWDFPDHFVRQSDEETRRELVQALAEKRMVRIDKSGKEVFVELLKFGFDHWENRFEPNWSRYWECVELDCNEEGLPTKVELVTVDKSFVRELEEYLPYLNFLDPEFGMPEISSVEEEAFTVGRWKRFERVYRSVRAVRSHIYTLVRDNAAEFIVDSRSQVNEARARLCSLGSPHCWP